MPEFLIDIGNCFFCNEPLSLFVEDPDDAENIEDEIACFRCAQAQFEE